MAFCTSCGNKMEEGVRFCTKCGASMVGAVAPAPQAAAPPPPAPAQAAPKQGGGALKIILIVAGVILALVIISVGVVSYIGYRAVKAVKATVGETGTTVRGSIGGVETTRDPAKVAQEIGVDIYPGARMLKEGGKMTFGGISAISAAFETDDPPGKVAEFYKGKFPDAMSTQDMERYSIVASTESALLTITIEPEGGRTKIKLARTSKR